MGRRLPRLDFLKLLSLRLAELRSRWRLLLPVRLQSGRNRVCQHVSRRCRARRTADAATETVGPAQVAERLAFFCFLPPPLAVMSATPPSSPLRTCQRGCQRDVRHTHSAAC